MASMMEDYEQLPFPPGEAPFRIKGTAYKGHAEYANAHVPGGMEAAIYAFQDHRIRAFFTQPFLASSFYDVYPLIAMGYVCARLTGSTFAGFLRTRARHQLESDVSGVYKMLLKMASHESVARKIPALTAQYFDFSPAEAEVVSPTNIAVRFRSMPADIAPWYAPIVETYVIGGLEVNGAMHPKVRLFPFKKGGQQHGVDVGTLRLDVSWG